MRAPSAAPAGPTTRSARANTTALAVLVLAAACTNVPPAATLRAPVANHVSLCVERLLESTDDPVATFNSAVHQLTGTDHISCSSVDDLERARIELQAYEASTVAPIESCLATTECYKAEKSDVIVKDVNGNPYTVHVPSTATQVMKSALRDGWIAADQKALDAILMDPRNVLVPTSKPKSLGLPIAPCVTARKLKLDKHTGQLDACDALKSRHCFDGNRHAALAARSGNTTFEPTSSTVADDLLIKLGLGDAAERDREITKLDVGNAYVKGLRKRPPTYLATPATLPIYDADGAPMCIELGGTPLWGEQCAGKEWQDTLHAGMIADGWLPAEDVPCCYRRVAPDGSDAFALTIVDDILVSETRSPSGRHPLALLLHGQLEKRYGKGEVKLEHNPTSFVGITVLRDRKRRALTINMAAMIEAAAREHIPEYVAGASLSSMGIPEGAKLRKMVDDLRLVPATSGSPKLTSTQRLTATIVGKCRWYDKVSPSTTRALHGVSCVVGRPPPEALLAAKAILAAQYDVRHVGITFGGGGLCTAPRTLAGNIYANFNMADGAPAPLEATADSTWDGNNVYSVLLTFNGGAVAHLVKKMHLIVDSSMESEAVATGKAGEIVTYAREILRAIGVPPDGPTFVGTDNHANALIASGRALPSRSRHCLRRYTSFLQRVRRGDVEIGHVPDPQNPSDYLTKWVSKEKTAMSVAFATNGSNAVA